MIIRALTGLLLSIGVPTMAIAVPVPGFRQLETTYSRGGGLPAATASLVAALPAGMTVARAQQKLEDAGGDCKREHHDPSTFKCLIHQYSFADRAAADVRWTIRLFTKTGQVQSLTVGRYVDQHGT